MTNKAGLTVSRFFGFGLMDAGKMVYLAEHWTKVPEQRRCEIKGEDENRFDAICISVKSLLELVTRIFAIWAKVAHITTRVPGWMLAHHRIPKYYVIRSITTPPGWDACPSQGTKT